MTLAVFYDDHRAVVEIAYALVIFFPGFHDEVASAASTPAMSGSALI